MTSLAKWTVTNIPLSIGCKPTEDELKEFFQSNEIKDMVPDSGTFIDAKSIVLDGAPAGMLVSDQVMQQLDLTATMRVTQFITIQDRYMINIQFTVAKMPDSNESLDELQQKYLLTCMAIANTFVFNGKYK